MIETTETGRALMIGALRVSGQDPSEIFSGARFCPDPLTPEEVSRAQDDQWYPNMPNWIYETILADLSEEAAKLQADLLTKRAPTTLRVNLKRGTREKLQAWLSDLGFETDANPLSPSALTIRNHARGLTMTEPFLEGWFEMQDAASQAVTDALTMSETARVLDYCAGGGGKSLAMAARLNNFVTACDANPARLRDLLQRAKRAGSDVRVQHNRADLAAAGFDLVLLDAPCSGSGSWRRAPEAKWRLTQEGLKDLVSVQREILSSTQEFVADGGILAYVTCSILKDENQAQSAWFTDQFPDWKVVDETVWPVSENGDGFFVAQFCRDA